MGFLVKAAVRVLTKMNTSPCKFAKRPFTVCIEGNIGSGKTTFVNHFKKFDNTVVLQEPVELWRNVSGTNLLELMYSDPIRYGFLFQSHVQLSMLELHTSPTSAPYKVMERSVYSGRCFIENMKRTNKLLPVEVVVLEQWYEWCIKSAHIETDLVVYLRTTPEVVYQRMKQRARKEENSVSLEYLKQMHDIHDEWLYKKTLFAVPAPVIVLDANKSLDEMLTEVEIFKSKIFNRHLEDKNEKKDTLSTLTSCPLSKITSGVSD